MTGNVALSIRTRRIAALWIGLAAGVATTSAIGAECPRPDALGTSRTLVVDAKAHPLIGSMQYRETLPLNDGEVVLTFDDGPLPKHSNQILEILAAQCVKATFFMVGRQAQANPEGVRKVRDAGHTVATHTQSHPSNMHRLAIERAKAEIDDGIASVTAALGEGGASAMSPFFRIPGLARNDAIEEYTRSKGLQIWSADFPADDWHHISSARVHDLAMSRLAAKGKGILLLHDIQPRTVAALPRILQDLKARGYRIVHVVPATDTLPATPTDPQQWQMRPTSELVATSRWPKIPTFVFAQAAPLPVPLLTDSYWDDGKQFDRPQVRGRGIPLPRQAPWPREVQLASTDAASALPVPAASVFEAEEGLRVVMLAATAAQPRQAEPRAAVTAEEKPEPAASRRGKRARVAAVRGKRVATVQQTRAKAAPKAAARPAAHATATPKRAAPDRKNVKRSVRHNQQAAL